MFVVRCGDRAGRSPGEEQGIPAVPGGPLQSWGTFVLAAHPRILGPIQDHSGLTGAAEVPQRTAGGGGGDGKDLPKPIRLHGSTQCSPTPRCLLRLVLSLCAVPPHLWLLPGLVPPCPVPLSCPRVAAGPTTSRSLLLPGCPCLWRVSVREPLLPPCGVFTWFLFFD